MKRSLLAVASLMFLTGCALEDTEKDLREYKSEGEEERENVVMDGIDGILDNFWERSEDNANAIRDGETSPEDNDLGSDGLRSFLSYTDEQIKRGSNSITNGSPSESSSESSGFDFESGESSTADADHVSAVYESLQENRSSEYIDGYVSYCYDGDTCTVEITGLDNFSNSGSLNEGVGDEVSVRFTGVNTSEIKEEEPFSQEAKENMESMVVGQNVQLELDKGFYDHYGRMLAYVWLSDGTLANGKQVEYGLAETMSIEPNKKYASEFRALENHAKEQEVNIWQ